MPTEEQFRQQALDQGLTADQAARLAAVAVAAGWSEEELSSLLQTHEPPQIRQGEYGDADATIRWTAVDTEQDIYDLRDREDGYSYEVVSWRQKPDGGAELVAWELPAMLLDTFLYDHEGDIGTVVSIRRLKAVTDRPVAEGGSWKRLRELLTPKEPEEPPQEGEAP